MHDWNDWGGSWWWLPMMVMMLAFWGGLIWVVAMLARPNDHGFHRHPPEPTTAPPARPEAQGLLAERLTRGEIEPDDYRKRLAALQETRSN